MAIHHLRIYVQAHLCWAIFLNRDWPDGWIMVLGEYAAYFDASGHPDGTPVLFVSGFVSTKRKWLRFERRWTDFLKRNGIVGPFHMTDFINGFGQYSSWRGDAQRQD